MDEKELNLEERIGELEIKMNKQITLDEAYNKWLERIDGDTDKIVNYINNDIQQRIDFVQEKIQIIEEHIKNTEKTCDKLLNILNKLS